METEFRRRILNKSEAAALSGLTLAHLGDAVFELLVRTHVTLHGSGPVKERHRKTVALVSAASQSKLFGLIEPHLTDEERSVFRRGRNAHSHSAPKSADTAAYHASTGLETLFGYLYITGATDRACELFDIMIGEYEKGAK